MNERITARDIFDKTVGKHHRELSPLNYEKTMEFAKEIAEKAYEAGFQRGKSEFPDKSTYMKQLFPESKEEEKGIRWTTPPWIEKALEPDSGPVSSGLPCDFDTDNPEKVKPI